MFHRPVLVAETLAWLELKPGDRVVDCTLGSGSHSLEMLQRITAPDRKGLLIGIDQDEEAIAEAAKCLAGFENKILLQANFYRFKQLLAGVGVSQVDKILIDCGVSMHQLKSRRGFSYRRPEDRLDSRMDAAQPFDAEAYLRHATLAQLEQAFDAVDAPLARKVAHALIDARKRKPLRTMGELLAVLRQVLPQGLMHKKTHFATQYLLAIRIAVNRELETLGEVLPQGLELLAPQGRIAVLTYHSAEDRVVKNNFKRFSGKCVCGQALCHCAPQAWVKVLTVKPVVPGRAEVKTNPAARSAKLRVAEKLGAASRTPHPDS